MLKGQQGGNPTLNDYTNKVTIIIGLSGSGKSTLAQTLLNKIDGPWRFEADWGGFSNYKVDNDGNIGGSFDEDSRFKPLFNHIKNGMHVILDGAYFCNHKFLCEAEYYLNLHFPNIEIIKYYFENNPKDATANVLFREWDGGNYWEINENDDLIFHGHHHTGEGPDYGRRQYEVIIETINKLSKDYIIPSKYPPIQIQVQDEKFYEGWRALIR